MNSREISQLFAHENQQFNPIETFGNRQAPQSQDRHYGRITEEKKRYNDRDRDRVQEQEEDRGEIDSVRQQTRIKLLSSYQESYLQSISHRNFTEGDQLSDLRGLDKSNNLSYSESKRSQIKLDHYTATDPNEQLPSPTKYSPDQNLIHYHNNEGTSSNLMGKFNTLPKTQQQNLPPKSQNKDLKDRNKDLGNKTRELSQAIEEQIYNLSVQDRIYEYLISRIDERGRVRPIKNHHQVIEKAIDFMDAGEQFMRSLAKLSKMQG